MSTKEIVRSNMDQDVPALAALGSEAIVAFRDIVKELARAALNSPLISILLYLVTVDLLEKQVKILSSDTALMAKVLLGAIVGVDLTADIASIAATLLGKGSVTEVLKPSAQVIVFGGEGAHEFEKLMPLLQSLVKK